jgi:hypothetical protein
MEAIFEDFMRESRLDDINSYLNSL